MVEEIATDNVKAKQNWAFAVITGDLVELLNYYLISLKTTPQC